MPTFSLFIAIRESAKEPDRNSLADADAHRVVKEPKQAILEPV
jgi:hypothetical protein